jgi:hypothetical protein
MSSTSTTNGGAASPDHIICRTISISEAELLRALRLHDAERAGYQLYRRLSRRHSDITPRDVSYAVRQVRLMAELWIDAVAARLDRLQPYGQRQPRYRRRQRKLPWPKVTALAAE